ncbi:MAG: hypothetical protein QOE65_1524 [Solirubrobacteraceae bacterium]|jgi:hypothetical protein|nr:hypothetical protein [Solirubrobacteraceae bacterium]
MRTLIASHIIMARTTLDLDPSVLRELRSRGRSERKSMGRVASELLARALMREDDAGAPRPLGWVSRDLGAPRVDLEDRDAVRDLLDRPS